MKATHIVAQEKLLPLKNIVTSAQFFTTDKEGNAYVLSNQYSIIKYNRNGDSITMYNTRRLGKIESIDASNPLRILVFYKSSQQLAVLDHMLSQKQAINLAAYGIYNIAAACSSADGFIWLYSNSSNELVKISADNKVSAKGFVLLQQLGKPLDVQYMTEQERTLYVLDSSHVYQFDAFGTLAHTYGIGARHLQCVGKQLLYCNDSSASVMNTATVDVKKMNLPAFSNLIAVRAERNRFYALRKNELILYATE